MIRSKDQMRVLFKLAAPVLSKQKGWSEQDLADACKGIADAFEQRDRARLSSWAAFLDEYAGIAIAQQDQRAAEETARVLALIAVQRRAPRRNRHGIGAE